VTDENRGKDDQVGVVPEGLTGRAERKAERSDALDWIARAGLVAYGVVHLLIAGITFQLAFSGGSSPGASSEGAFALLAQNTLGAVTLWLIGAGMLLLVVWQGVEAFTGHLDSDGIVRLGRRIASASRAVVYAVLGYEAVSFALGARSGSNKKHMTAQLMSAPAGPFLVGLVGAVIVGIGIGLAVLGITGRFMKRLDHEAEDTERRIPIKVLGRVGYLGKSLAFGAVGSLFVVAAVQHQPKDSGGLDVALHRLLGQPFGPLLVSLVALGIGCFGLYCFAWARHIDR
jgi:hypothetical protein